MHRRQKLSSPLRHAHCSCGYAVADITPPLMRRDVFINPYFQWNVILKSSILIQLIMIVLVILASQIAPFYYSHFSLNRLQPLQKFT